ncbi:MAG: hypothetical protein GX886_01210 [Comamonadaceae bacterium]|nr:hypothetical protein [Comamonadaceae bacterium]
MSHSPAQLPAADTEAPVHPSRMQRLAAIAQCLLQHLDTPLLVVDAQGSLLEASAGAPGSLASTTCSQPSCVVSAMRFSSQSIRMAFRACA